MINKYPYTDFNEYNMDWIIKTVKDLTVAWAETKTEWGDMQTEWTNYKNYINNYFNNLDISQEISDKIDAMISDGSFQDVIAPFFADAIAEVPTIVSEWIDANLMQEVGYVIDASLTTENAAADALAAGAMIRSDKEIMSEELGYIWPAWEQGNISSVGESSTPYILRTGYIPTAAGEKITVYFPAYFPQMRILFFREDNYNTGSYLGQTTINDSGTTVTATIAGTNYMRFKADPQDNVNPAKVLMGSEIAIRIDGTGDINATVKKVSETPDDIDFIVAEIKTDEFVVPDDLTANYYVDYENGNQLTNLNYSVSGIITIPKGCTRIEHDFPFSISGTDGYALYDAAMTYISGGKDHVIKIPSEARYINISARNDSITTDSLFITFKESVIDNKGYNVVMLGDSIIGNTDDETSIPALLSFFTKANCYNCAFPGSSMGSDLNAPNEWLEPFNGWKIVDAIISNDYSVQQDKIDEDITHEHYDPVYQEHLDTLKSMDWSTVDIITLSFGTNDWGTRVILDNPGNPMDTDTFTGALRSSLEMLWSAYPEIKVMICGLIWRGLTISAGGVTEDSDNSKQGRNWYLYEYEDKAKEVAEEYHVPFVPMYDHTNFNKFTWAQYYKPPTDATHPGPKGRYVIAKRYANYLTEL